jgi:hypothetical protein
MASNNYMCRRIIVAIIRLCSFKGKFNAIASSIWFDVEIASALTLSVMQYITKWVCGGPCI